MARPHLRELALEVGEDVYLGLQMGRRVFYADRILGTQRISLDIRLGEPLYLHTTATGKLFAAFAFLALGSGGLIGLVLGLIGGGGSILTVPLLAYVAGMDAKPAIATSLLVVGVTSAVAEVGPGHQTRPIQG